MNVLDEACEANLIEKPLLQRTSQILSMSVAGDKSMGQWVSVRTGLIELSWGYIATELGEGKGLLAHWQSVYSYGRWTGSEHSKHGGCLSYDTVTGALLQPRLSACWFYLKKACRICYKRCGCNIRTWRNPGEALQVHRGDRDMAICRSEQETHYTTWPVVGYQPLVSVGNCNHSNTS